MEPIFIKYTKRLGYAIFLLFFCLTVIEICFRYQIFDFYKPELKGLNTEGQLVSPKNNILVFGDSFSAHPESYVSHLRKEFPNYNFINSAIPGTGIKQHELIFKKRLQRFQPKAIIYQFYVGNDFTDIEHPINFKKLSFFRNVFWKLSENFIVLQYINHRLAFLNSNNLPIKKLQEEKFSITSYNHRVKIYYKANPSSLNNTILIRANSKKLYTTWKEKIASLSKLTNDTIPIYLLIIPHNAQLNTTSLEKNRLLGAKLLENILISDYPFLKQIKKDFKTWKVINPLTEFQLNKNQDSLYYQNDPHLTLYGQKQLVEIVINNLNLNLED